MLVQINDRPLLIGGMLRLPGVTLDVNDKDARDLEIRRLVTPVAKLTKPDWFPDWSNNVAVIVASGPSARTVPLTIARKKAKLIVVNNSWILAPWADYLFGIDYAWWQTNKGVPRFEGEKISLRSDGKWGIKDVRMHDHIEKFVVDSPGLIGNGGNSGFGAINLAIQFGAKGIILVGFDMNGSRGYHWHTDHPRGLKNPDEDCLRRWARKLDDQKPLVDSIGVAILNACPDSALKAYDKVNFVELFK